MIFRTSDFSGMAESTAGISQRNERGVLPSPGSASLLYLKIARGRGREGLSVSPLQQNLHTELASPCRGMGKGPLEKGNIFWMSDKAGGRTSVGNCSECCCFIEG